METFVAILIIGTVILYPKIKKEMELNEMKKEIDYCAEHNIKLDTNKLIGFQGDKILGKVNESDFRRLYASGYFRKVEK